MATVETKLEPAAVKQQQPLPQQMQKLEDVQPQLVPLAVCQTQAAIHPQRIQMHPKAQMNYHSLRDKLAQEG
jgi:hypothetical protein